MSAKITPKGARVSAGYTQEAMANEIGISRVHLIALENGRAPFNRPVLLAWSKVTGFEVDDFILPEVSTQRQTEEVE